MTKKIICLALLGASTTFSVLQAQSEKQAAIPAVLSGMAYDASGVLTYTTNGQVLKDAGFKDLFQIGQMQGNPKGTAKGMSLDFNLPDFDGTIAYGPVNEGAKYPTVLWGNGIVAIKKGKTELDIKKLLQPNSDFFHIAESGRGVLGFRVMSKEGILIYDGRIAFTGKGPYTVVPTIIEGPFINELSPEGCVISFETHVPVQASVNVDGKTIKDPSTTTHHELTVSGLKAGTSYPYTVNYGERSDNYTFKTAPSPGTRKPFTFAYASATRSNSVSAERKLDDVNAHILGGGEHNIWGVNAQALQAIMAIAGQENAVFFQATGDITSGNTSSAGGHLLDYANWKRVVEPWWHSIPVYVGMGNHESVFRYFTDPSGKIIRMGNFPYKTTSGEAVFAKAFVHPQNGPVSEDGAIYDPNPNQMDFPSYKENVYYYTYDNAGMIVLNGDYWLCSDTTTSSNRDGYIMDNQLKWLAETVDKLERDASIDHIFVTVHTSIFPNGDHMSDAFWHNGNNNERAKVAGKPVAKGVIERRDEILDILVNKSQKFVAILTGDEHNFALTEATPDIPMYPSNYTLPKLKLKRPFYQVLNGAGGSAVYSVGGEWGRPIWINHVKVSAAPPVVGLITIDNKQVTVKAINSETLETVCQPIRLR